MELYFKHVHGQTYSFLHKPTLIPRIKEGKVNRTLILALCGLTARYSRHPKILCNTPHEAGENFIAAARKALSEEFDEPTLELVQAVIIIVQHDFFRSKGKKSMIYVSLALRMATTLELHIEPNDPSLTFQEREARRRTYWSLVVFDRLAHSGPHWQVHLRTDTLHLQLPCKDYYYENNIPVVTETLQGAAPPPIRVSQESPSVRKEDLAIFAYIVMATILWCDINKYVMEEFKDEKIAPWKEGSKYHALETRLQKLFASLPKEYQYSKERLMALDTLNQGTGFIHLHIELLFSLCHLSRSMYPFNHKKMKFKENPPKAFIERAAINIMSSANAQTAMISDVLSMEDFNMAPFVGFGVFTVSSVHIANSFSPDPAVAAAAKNNLAINLKFLVIMREYWYSVGVWCIALKDRYFQKARRHKLKTQQDSYAHPGQTARSFTMVESPSNNGDLAAEADQAAEVFSRPGSPPLAYAPEDVISVATNRLPNSYPSSYISSPNGTGSRSRARTPEEPPLKRERDINSNTIPDSSARTWERAVSQTYDRHQDKLHYQAKLEDMDHGPSSKRAKVHKSSGSVSKDAPNHSSPASPSQFADIFSMPSISPNAPTDQISNTSDPYSVKENDFSTPSSTTNSTQLQTESRPVGMTGLGTKSKNNLLQDNSGEWLNSLELSEFTRFANDDRSLIDFNNPTYWFETEMKLQLEEQDRDDSTHRVGMQALSEDLQENSKRTSISLNHANQPEDLRQVDQSLFQQSLIHQPFAPEPDISEEQVSNFNHATPKTQSLLDEIFQQVALETVSLRDVSESPEPLSPD